LSEAGEPLKMAQAQLGHADLQTTLGFTHFMPESKWRAVGKIPALLEIDESTLSKAVRRISGGPGSHPKNESRQSTLGRSAHPWGIAETRH